MTKLTAETLTVEAVKFKGHFRGSPDEVLSQHKVSAFTVDTLAASLHEKCSFEAIKAYLQSYDASTVHGEMLESVNDHLIITHVIERNDPKLLRLFLEYEEVDPSALDFFGEIPVLAFAIMRSKQYNENTTNIVKTLLAFGADPNVIPEELWIEYVRAPAPVRWRTDFKITSLTTWCTTKRQRLLAETLNLTMRYSLWRAAHMEPVKTRKMQIAKANRIQPLLRIPHLIIGQNIATRLVIDNIFGHITIQKQKPLVLAFAGLSGHGKTELASQLGNLLCSPFIDIDCAQTSTLFTLLGPTAGYQGHDIGSPLNNFLAGNADRLAVVFLDEFDKTQQEVRDALLKVMDNGELCEIAVWEVS
jgi:ATP-dependent Clp protease ATP-binding subunit ClpB